MNEREKIIEIIAPFISAYGEDGAIADTLIAANIGDVTAWKERAKKHRFMALPDGRIKQLYSDEEVEQIAQERDEYKHRAEVAERALLNLARFLRKRCFLEDDEVVKKREQELYDAWIAQAEKELAEEDKR